MMYVLEIKSAGTHVRKDPKVYIDYHLVFGRASQPPVWTLNDELSLHTKGHRESQLHAISSLPYVLTEQT